MALKQFLKERLFKTVIYIYILRGFRTSGNTFRLPYSIAFDGLIRPFLCLFHSWLYRSHLSRFLGEVLVFILPSGFQLTMIFSNRVGSILSTLPYQMSCFRVIQYRILLVHFKTVIKWSNLNLFYANPLKNKIDTNCT